MSLQIARLDADSPLLDTVLDWHWREWSHGETGANLDEWRARLRSRTGHDRIPFTLVAHLDGEPVGCLTVCEDDADRRFADRGPWLSGMLVVGRARNLGVGRALARTAVEQARALGRRELWVWTTEAGPFYERCGWSYVARKEGLRDHAVLRYDCGAAPGVTESRPSPGTA